MDVVEVSVTLSKWRWIDFVFVFLGENGFDSLAVITFIPLKTKQHFIPFTDINQCLLADICNHTWIPECGYYDNKTHHRLFLDECDMFEYNCDNNMFYKVTNYSACFSPQAGCLTVPPLLTRVQGFYIYYADGRRMMYTPTTSKKPTKRTTYYTLPTAPKPKPTTRTTHWNDRRRYTPQATGKYKPWSDDTTTKTTTEVIYFTRATPLETPPIELIQRLMADLTVKRPIERNRKRKTKRTTKRTTKRSKPTTQILRTGTTATVILKKMTVWKDGKIVVKVVKGKRGKGFKAPVVTNKDDSDFLE